jgi:hypothetical protein
MKNGWIIAAIGIGAFLGVVLVCGGLGAAFLWMVRDEFQNIGVFTPVTGIDYTLSGPDSVNAGETATFVIEVTNTSTTDDRVLYSIDLYTELVGQGPVAAVPAGRPFYADEGDTYAELIYQLPLPPGATERIEVQFTPNQPGRYEVNIDVCIDTAFSFIERFHTLIVRPAEADD